MRELDALRAQCAELYSEVTHLHSEVDVVENLCEVVTRLGRDVEKVAASLTDTANMQDEAVERTDNLHAQLTASIRREDAYK